MPTWDGPQERRTRSQITHGQQRRSLRWRALHVARALGRRAVEHADEALWQARYGAAVALVNVALRAHIGGALSRLEGAEADLQAQAAHALATLPAPQPLQTQLVHEPSHDTPKRASYRASSTAYLPPYTRDGDGLPLRTPSAPPLPPLPAPAPRPQPQPQPQQVPLGQREMTLAQMATALAQPRYPGTVNKRLLARLCGRLLRDLELRERDWPRAVATRVFDLAMAIGAGRVEDAGRVALVEAEMTDEKTAQANGPTAEQENIPPREE